MTRLKTFFENRGFIGIGFSEKPTDIDKEINETLDYTMLKGSFNYAKNLILNIKCGENISFVTIYEISSRILENFDENAEALLGCRAEDGFSPDEVQIVLVTA